MTLSAPIGVARLAILRLWSNSRIRVVTSEADRMTARNRLERALLQPEIIADVFRGLHDIFFARFPLRSIRLVTDGTTLGRRRFFLLKQNGREQLAAIQDHPHDVDVFVMRKANAEF